MPNRNNENKPLWIILRVPPGVGKDLVCEALSNIHRLVHIRLSKYSLPVSFTLFTALKNCYSNQIKFINPPFCSSVCFHLKSNFILPPHRNCLTYLRRTPRAFLQASFEASFTPQRAFSMGTSRWQSHVLMPGLYNERNEIFHSSSNIFWKVIDEVSGVTLAWRYSTTFLLAKSRRFWSSAYFKRSSSLQHMAILNLW